jgi:hypothetical protein
VFRGEVVGITDGDTMNLLDSSHRQHINAQRQIMSAWNEEEVKIAVEGYFELLGQEGNGVNKAELYRTLSSRCPSRSPKAFERKFQNISAILYEQHLSYASGLKPLGNYQNLLKLIVLDHLDRTPLPSVEPYEILEAKLRDISDREIEVTSTGSGRYGLAIEEALGIPQNSSKAPDFMGIELKTKSDKSLQTLFSRTPSKFLAGKNKADFFDLYAYQDNKRNRRALYTSFCSREDTLGFSLSVDNLTVSVLHKGRPVVEYEGDRLEAALLSKHSQTAFIEVAPSKGKVRIKSAIYCRSPSVIRFMELIAEELVYLDFTMSESTPGRMKDHGFLWRIRPEAISKLYLHSEDMKLA